MRPAHSGCAGLGLGRLGLGAEGRRRRCHGQGVTLSGGSGSHGSATASHATEATATCASSRCTAATGSALCATSRAARAVRGRGGRGGLCGAGRCGLCECGCGCSGRCCGFRGLGAGEGGCRVGSCFLALSFFGLDGRELLGMALADAADGDFHFPVTFEDDEQEIFVCPCGEQLGEHGELRWICGTQGADFFRVVLGASGGVSIALALTSSTARVRTPTRHRIATRRRRHIQVWYAAVTVRGKHRGACLSMRWRSDDVRRQRASTFERSRGDTAAVGRRAAHARRAVASGGGEAPGPWQWASAVLRSGCVPSAIIGRAHFGRSPQRRLSDLGSCFTCACYLYALSGSAARRCSYPTG